MPLTATGRLIAPPSRSLGSFLTIVVFLAFLGMLLVAMGEVLVSARSLRGLGVAMGGLLAQAFCGAILGTAFLFAVTRWTTTL